MFWLLLPHMLFTSATFINYVTTHLLLTVHHQSKKSIHGCNVLVISNLLLSLILKRLQKCSNMWSSYKCSLWWGWVYICRDSAGMGYTKFDIISNGSPISLYEGLRFPTLDSLELSALLACRSLEQIHNNISADSTQKIKTCPSLWGDGASL